MSTPCPCAPPDTTHVLGSLILLCPPSQPFLPSPFSGFIFPPSKQNKIPQILHN